MVNALAENLTVEVGARAQGTIGRAIAAAKPQGKPKQAGGTQNRRGTCHGDLPAGYTLISASDLPPSRMN
ncbi:MAG: hypothetical protein M5U09_26535, partial [Gammaproteobacteria bacterium]|nr:hypothetical protein [Gammaproteobacteria bacterium]